MKRPTYTKASVIKKVFRPGERSLPRNEILERLNEYLSEPGSEGNGERTLDEILKQPDTPIRTGSSDAIIELTYQPHHVFDLAFRYLRDTHAPRTTDQIIREIRRQTNLSWNQATRLLVLEKDPRFVRFEGDNRWYLAEWKLVNDVLYKFAQTKNITYMSIRALSHVFENDLGLLPKGYVFLPELDERFEVEGEIITFFHPSAEEVQLVTEESEAPSSTTEAIASAEESVENNSANSVRLEQQSIDEHDHMQQAVATQKETAVSAATVFTQQPTEENETQEELIMNTTQIAPAFHEVDQLLRQSLTKLQTRHEEMAQEVVAHFQQNNMQAIEVLMQEKHKNEQATQGIQQVLALLDQQ